MKYWLFVLLYFFSATVIFTNSDHKKDLPVDPVFLHRDWDRQEIYFYNDNYWQFDWGHYIWRAVEKEFDIPYMTLKGKKWIKVIPENSIIIP